MADDDPLADDGEAARGVTLPELIERHIRAAIAEQTRTWLPARVVRFDADKQQADCKVLIADFHRDETGKLTTSSVPVITNVPVWFLTAGGFTFTVPIKAGQDGTLGMLIFADRSMDRWLSGNGKEVGDPELYSRHNLTDAVFLAGVLPFGAPMGTAPPTDHATAGSVSGARIHFRDSTICIGDESGSDFLALAQKVSDQLTILKNAITNAVVVAQDGGASLKSTILAALNPPALIPAWPQSMAADQAKGK
jgi:hypothetical protein